MTIPNCLPACLPSPLNALHHHTLGPATATGDCCDCCVCLSASRLPLCVCLSASASASASAPASASASASAPAPRLGQTASGTCTPDLTHQPAQQAPRPRQQRGPLYEIARFHLLCHVSRARHPSSHSLSYCKTAQAEATQTTPSSPGVAAAGLVRRQMLNAMAHDGHGSAVHRSSPQFSAPHRFSLLSHDSHARLLCPPLPCAICRTLSLPFCLNMTLTMAWHHGMAPWRPDVVDRVSKHIITVCTCTAWSKSAAFARLRSLPVRCRRAGRRMLQILFASAPCHRASARPVPIPGRRSANP
jgi:hypothetical protein